MHSTLKDWLERIKEKYPATFKDRHVCEMGSLIVNGSPRDLFENCAYTGVDFHHGEGVDVVSLAHEFKPPDRQRYQTVISTEMLEHDPYWALSIGRMLELLEKDGDLIISAASPKRGRHNLKSAPDGKYYAGIGMSQLLVHTAAKRFLVVRAEEELSHNDVYLFCHKKLED